MNFLNKIKFLSSQNEEDKELCNALTNMLGFKPRHLTLYVLALTHKSCNENSGNNERLEFLGDAFIGAIVANYLYKKYPTEDEGFLTDMRSKIVSRRSMDDIGRRMGVHKLIKLNHNEKLERRSHIIGNAVEALVAAVLLDVGYNRAEKFFLSRVLEPHIDIDKLEQTEYNFKNKLYSWAQQQDKCLEFNTLSEDVEEGGRKIFTIGIFIDGEKLCSSTGFSKKEAGQLAAEAALEQLGLATIEE